MMYTVVGVQHGPRGFIRLWDGVTRDADHPEMKAGLMTMHIGEHTFDEGDTVNVTIKLVKRKEQT